MLSPTLNESYAETPYQGYSYSYPHKTAYRAFDVAKDVGDVWKNETLDSLFLYVHVPFCEMRCGFCNLFTTSGSGTDLVDEYLLAVERQMRSLHDHFERRNVTRFALGGGTPTFLSTTELDTLFSSARKFFGYDPTSTPSSVEVSPNTLDRGKLDFLREQKIDRISIGVQSFDRDEATALGRPQDPDEVTRSLEIIRNVGFATLNIDLIYGAVGQSRDSWIRSIERALEFQPEELYLYPLYVRPKTGLERKHDRLDPADLRLELYRAGRDFLRERGYSQVSMRMFRGPNAPDEGGPAYCCQTDGMLGVGCGARSYTADLHYSSRYAVGTTGVREILRDFVTNDEDDFARVDYGYALDDEDKRRRFLIQSLLQVEGIDRDAYGDLFGSKIDGDFPELAELQSLGLVSTRDQRIQLTDPGLELSDRIGPKLYSRRVQERMKSYALT
ncbi:MAG: STM4012 family radical SAM protein [Planctomycetota bacterium]